MSKAIFKIHITNWIEHNPSSKKTYKKTLIANNLISDAKVLSLTMSQRWLFINLLLIAGDYANDTVTLTERQVNEILTTKEGANNCLARLQSLQLVTFEKTPLIEVKEEKEIKERNKRIATTSAKRPNELNLKTWEAYRLAYFNRYKVDPTRNKTVNGKISQLAARLGVDAIEVVQFYLKHNDSFYLKSTHSIGLCLSHAESLHTQWKRNQAVTGNDVRNFERKLNLVEVEKAFLEGENF